jgi:hypothetical protein
LLFQGIFAEQREVRTWTAALEERGPPRPPPFCVLGVCACVCAHTCAACMRSHTHTHTHAPSPAPHPPTHLSPQRKLDERARTRGAAPLCAVRWCDATRVRARTLCTREIHAPAFCFNPHVPPPPSFFAALTWTRVLGTDPRPSATMQNIKCVVVGDGCVRRMPHSLCVCD